MNKNKGCNLWATFFTIVIFAITLLCVLSPAIFAFIKAGMEDGFSFAAFDLGPSEWWNIGMLALFLGLAVLCGIGCRIAKEKQDGRE